MSNAIAPAPVLSAHGLEYRYGAVRAVQGIDLLLNTGELLAIIGPNGAGKSTVFGVLSGELPAQTPQGRIDFNGQNIATHSIQKRAALGLGRTFQTAMPFNTLTVLDNLTVAAQVFPEKTQQALAHIPQLLTACGLLDRQHSPVNALSYADWKRLDLALALVQSPKVLLLDEPTAGLAPDERHQMMTYIRSLPWHHDIAIIFTEHNLDAVFSFADRVMVLARGKVIAVGEPSDIAANTLVQEAYTGSYAFKPSAIKV